MRWLPSLVLAAAVSGCSNLTEVDGLVGLDVTVPRPPEVEVGQTIQLQARPFNRNGDSVSVAVTWVTLDNTVSLTSDGRLTGVIGGGTARVQAQAGTIVSDLITINVIFPPDTIALTGDSTLTVPASATASNPLLAGLFSRQSGTQQPVVGRKITYQVTSPAFTDPSQRTVELTGGALMLTATTGSDGTPSPLVSLNRVTGTTAPATAIVTVSATTGAGATVPGSGQRFIVNFQ